MPSVDIMNINNTPLKIKVRIGVFTFEPERTALLVKELQESYKTEGEFKYFSVLRAFFQQLQNYFRYVAAEC